MLAPISVSASSFGWLLSLLSLVVLVCIFVMYMRVIVFAMKNMNYVKTGFTVRKWFGVTLEARGKDKSVSSHW
jgi:hypothetical protein